MTRRKRSNLRRNTRNKNKRQRKSQIRIVKDSSELTSRELARRKRAQREKERLYKRRRIGLGVLALVIILIPSFFLYKKFHTYGKDGYPAFRDEVLEDLSKTAFISSTEGRSLTSAEKNADFDILYDTICKNFAVDKVNAESFEEFTKKRDKYKKKITKSKTDQDFFLILGEYLNLLNDSATKILDKESYTDLFNYYKNKKEASMYDILGNAQVI